MLRGRVSISALAWLTRAVVVIAALWSCACSRSAPTLDAERSAAFLTTYSEIALADYTAALADARALSKAVDAFVQQPSADRFQAARRAWISARQSYAQTEAYRFYGGPIDAVELQLNTWPIDENYLEAEDGQSGIVVDATRYPDISPSMLAALNLREGETSVSTGYHAVEFLLWGRDRRADGPGDRSFHDYDTAPYSRRRGEYLRAASVLLVENLSSVEAAWRGPYREAFRARPTKEALALAIKGLGSLSGGELLGERLSVAYETRAQENEHSCFSDNTHEDLVFDAVGIRNVCLGRYGSAVHGVGLVELVGSVDARLAAELERDVTATVEAMSAIPAPFDQAILGSDDGPGRRAIRGAMAALRVETDVFAKVAKALDVRPPSAIERAP